MMAHGDAREGKWRGNWRLEWVASTLHTTSEQCVSSITTADAHTSAASSRLNWRPRRFKWACPFPRKRKSGFCACAIIFQTRSTCGTFVAPNSEEKTPRNLPELGSKLAMPSTACIKALKVGHVIILCVKHHAMPTYWGTDVYLSAISVLVLHGGRRSASGHGWWNQEREPVPVGQAECVGSTVRLDTLDQLQFPLHKFEWGLSLP